MPELHRARMQEHPRQPRQAVRRSGASDAFVQFEVTILVVTDDRKSEVRKVHANLMCATRLQVRLQQGKLAVTLAQTENGMRFHAVRINADPAFTVSVGVLRQRQSDMLPVIDPIAFDQYQI